jgi:hypothetical protein
LDQLRISGLVKDQKAGIDAMRDTIHGHVHRMAMPAEVIALFEQRHILASPSQTPRTRQTGDAGTDYCYFHVSRHQKFFVQDK